MRITGGKAKGRFLASLKGMAIRPTSDKVREAVFNLLGQDITGLTVLDLFAGTGSLGIEALSRGALWAFFIDSSKKSTDLIWKNLVSCGFEDVGFVMKRDLRVKLPMEQNLLKDGVDIVFLDPPYGKDLISPTLMKLSKSKILTSNSLVVAESSRRDRLPSRVGNISLSDTRIYGQTKIDIYNSEVS